MQWITNNLDKVLAALTAVLALGDWTHVIHAEWAVAVAAILTFIAEWLHPRFVVPPRTDIPTQPQPRK